MKKIILDLCGGSGSWARPYKNAGYEVKTITLPNYDVTKVVFGGDYIIFLPQTPNAPQLLLEHKNIHGIFAAPPCQSFSYAPRPNGKHSKGSKFSQEDGLLIVNACLEIIKRTKPKFWAMENPVGELRKRIGNPRFTFQPYEFGDGWTKRTDIWGEFNLPIKTHTWETCPKLQLYIRPTRSKPSITFLHLREIMTIPQLAWAKDYCQTDADARAITPPAFAEAFYKANCEVAE